LEFGNDFSCHACQSALLLIPAHRAANEMHNTFDESLLKHHVRKLDDWVTGAGVINWRPNALLDGNVALGIMSRRLR
jgi:hypothetical protein